MDVILALAQTHSQGDCKPKNDFQTIKKHILAKKITIKKAFGD